MNKKKVDLQKNKFASSRSSKQKLKKSKRTESSKRWISRQLNDPYVSEAQKRGYRSRSAFKLLQINEKFNLFKSGMVIIDLGCAPGGWLQVAKKFGPKSSKIVGIDLLKIEKIDDVVSIEKDIFDEDIKEIIQKNFTNKVGLLMSDMSPNSSGNKKIDHLRIISLIERVLEIAKEVLKPDGFLVSKIFQGGAQGDLIEKMKSELRDIKYFKPKASRKQSPETYLIAKKN